jgi:hypothetical protein
MDIRESIENIDGFLKEMDFDAYRADLKTRSAEERQLQIISEAAARLKDDGERLCPGIDPSHDRRYLAGLLCSQLWSLPSHCPAKMI